MSFDYPAYFREAAEHCVKRSHRDDLELAATIIEKQKKALFNLLAVLHRDGGQYTDTHGIDKSVADAMKIASNKVVK